MVEKLWTTVDAVERRFVVLQGHCSSFAVDAEHGGSELFRAEIVDKSIASTRSIEHLGDGNDARTWQSVSPYHGADLGGQLREERELLKRLEIGEVRARHGIGVFARHVVGSGGQ